jgi:hypothetical protein
VLTHKVLKWTLIGFRPRHALLVVTQASPKTSIACKRSLVGLSCRKDIRCSTYAHGGVVRNSSGPTNSWGMLSAPPALALRCYVGADDHNGRVGRD